MASVSVQVPFDLAEQLMAQLQPRIDAALKVGEQVGGILRDRAILDNEDVHGEQMPDKKPRPKKNPSNFPGIALIQRDTLDEMNPDRWSVEQTGLTEVTVTYKPSDHHDYLVQKAPEAGGRNWLNQEEMNPNARQEIETLMREAMEK